MFNQQRDYYHERCDAISGEFRHFVLYLPLRLHTSFHHQTFNICTQQVLLLKILEPFHSLLTSWKTSNLNYIPAYNIAAVEDLASTTDVLEWWRGNEKELPHWAKACRRVLLILQLWKGSFLNNAFHKQQESSMEDYIESSLMLQHNRN